MSFLLLLFDLCLECIRNFRKAKRDSKILFPNDKSLTKITNAMTIGSVKFLSQNCLNALIG